MNVRIGIVAIVLLSVFLSTGIMACSSSKQQSEVDFTETKNNSDNEIQVHVVDKQLYSMHGASSEYQITTDYRYDSSGKVIESIQSTNDPSNSHNLCKAVFEYDDHDRLLKVSNAYEQYEWSVGNTIDFAYNDTGNCSSCTYTITSQGIGSHESVYEYDQDGRVIFATVSEYSTPSADPLIYTLTYEYSENGVLTKIISDSSTYFGLSFDEEMSDEDSGVFAYRDSFGATTTLRFDSFGNLESVDATSPNGGWNHIEYTYKTITVKASDFAPTIYSNPTGFDVEVFPQLDNAKLSSIYEAV